MPRYIYKYCCGAMYDATHDPCPTCHGASKPSTQRAAAVIGDDIPAQMTSGMNKTGDALDGNAGTLQ